MARAWFVDSEGYLRRADLAKGDTGWADKGEPADDGGVDWDAMNKALRGETGSTPFDRVQAELKQADKEYLAGGVEYNFDPSKWGEPVTAESDGDINAKFDGSITDLAEDVENNFDKLAAFAWAFQGLADRIAEDGDEFVISRAEEVLIVKALRVASLALFDIIDQDNDEGNGDV